MRFSVSSSRGGPSLVVGTGQTAIATPLEATLRVGGVVSSFGNHPRLFLNAARLAEVQAKRNTSHADYLSVKSHVDTWMPTWAGVKYSSLNGGITSTATTLTVVDGSSFPTSDFRIIIDSEVLHVSTRTGNVMAISERAYLTPGFSEHGIAAAHFDASPVWYTDSSGGDFRTLSVLTPLIVQAGDTSYATKARHILAVLTAVTFGGFRYWSGDYVRWFGVDFMVGVDMMWNDLTATEKVSYAECCRLVANAHLTDAINVSGAKEQYAIDVVGRTSAIQASITGNIASAQVYACLVAAIVSDGWNVEAPAQFAAAKSKLDNYIVPAIESGVMVAGNIVEGSEYSGEAYIQIWRSFEAIKCAAGSSAYDSVQTSLCQKTTDFLIHSTLPGSSNSAVTTTATGSIASTTITVASATGWAIGEMFRLTNPPDFFNFETAIVNISGTTFTIRDPLPRALSGHTIKHIAREASWGDATEGDKGLLNSIVNDGHQAQMFHNINTLRTADATRAQYCRYYLDSIGQAEDRTAVYYKFAKLLFDDTTVGASDYTLAMSTLFSTASSESVGMLLGRSAWTPAATYVHFLAGKESYDHVHSCYNSYYIRRKGVELSTEIQGYSVVPWPASPTIPNLMGGKFVGPKVHNAIEMNGHGGNAMWGMNTDAAGVASLSRSELTSTYMYGRGDASGIFTSSSWVAFGWTSNAAQTFVRDFLYLKAADLIVFADRLGYTGASVSPTKWFAQFTGDPAIAGQRITSTYAGQSIVQDIILPASATLTRIDEIAEYPDLDDKFTRPYYRVETVSGANTATEYSLQVIQVGDSGFSTLATTLLTTTNANVVQIGSSYVVGAVKGASPTLNITYDVVGTPRNLVMGMAASTAYHVTRATNTITIAAATGLGDTTSTTGGLLDFTL